MSQYGCLKGSHSFWTNLPQYEMKFHSSEAADLAWEARHYVTKRRSKKLGRSLGMRLFWIHTDIQPVTIKGAKLSLLLHFISENKWHKMTFNFLSLGLGMRLQSGHKIEFQSLPPLFPSYWLPTNSSLKRVFPSTVDNFRPLDECAFLGMASFPGCFSLPSRPGNNANSDSKGCHFDKQSWSCTFTHVQKVIIILGSVCQN